VFFVVAKAGMTPTVIFCPKHLKGTLFNKSSSSHKHNSNLNDTDDLTPPYVCPTTDSLTSDGTTGLINHADHDSYDNQIKSFYMTNLSKIHLSASRDWELLNPSSEDHEHSSSSLSPPMNSSKDILLRSLPSSTEEGDERLKQQGAQVRSIPWTPKIVIDKKLGKHAAKTLPKDSKGKSREILIFIHLIPSLLPLPSQDLILFMTKMRSMSMMDTKSPAVAARSHCIHARISMKRSGMSLEKIRELRSKC
jgi:hypothetical protein